MSRVWSPAFPRVPSSDWTSLPLEELARKYDTVETHGWYSNLEPTVEALAATLASGDTLIDYSGGTGILARRLLERLGDRAVRIVIVDASPKFLRMALERLGDEPRVAFRHLRWRRDERRLDLLDEAVDIEAMGGPASALVSTNAVHLYSALDETLASWKRSLRTDAVIHVQSGNIQNPEAEEGSWIIDATVDAIHEAAVGLVRSDARWERFRAVLEDAAAMGSHEAQRHRFFLPVRPLEHYTGRFEAAGIRVESVTTRTIEAKVDDWHAFLSAYHEGVLGWAGGSRRVEGEEPSSGDVACRIELMRAAMDVVFGGASAFPCCWTYLSARS